MRGEHVGASAHSCRGRRQCERFHRVEAHPRERRGVGGTVANVDAVHRRAGGSGTGGPRDDGDVVPATDHLHAEVVDEPLGAAPHVRPEVGDREQQVHGRARVYPGGMRVEPAVRGGRLRKVRGG